MDIKKTKEYVKVKSLILGDTFSGEYFGAKYTINCKWGGDWSVVVNMLSFEPDESSDLAFWMNDFKSANGYLLKELMYNTVRNLPEVQDFQRQIDYFKNMDEALLDEIFDELENERNDRIDFFDF